jgi:riboflavin kinase/FMN adenylyltransferase
MQVYYGTDSLPAFQNAVLTIGTFDGVHNGHQKIINALLLEANRINGESVIITFDPHPRKIVHPDQPLQLINTLEEKIILLQKTGIGHLVIVAFTEAFAQLSAADYIGQFLIKNFKPATIIIGYDHHFGKNREGNYQLLDAEKEKWGYRLIEIPPHILSEITISSTKIRNALWEGKVEIANQLLGYSFFFSGTVVKGDAIGRTLGYPTANLENDDSDKISLGDGVYAVYAQVKGIKRKGMLSIGTRPTLTDPTRKTEVYLFDFNESIYGADMRVSVCHFLRKQVRFDSLDILMEQMKKDEAKAVDLLR